MKTFAAILLLSAVAFAASEQIDWANIKPMDVYPKGLEGVLGNSQLLQRIVGGAEARNGQFPYQTGLIMDGQSFCGGSLIAKNWILTAAHCVDGVNQIDAYLGTHNIQTTEAGQQVIKVTKGNFIIHSGWNANTLSNDIALIKLPENARLGPNINTIALPSAADAAKTYVGDTCVASGWGRPSDAATGISPVLRYVDLKVISNTDCAKFFGTYVKASNICTDGGQAKSTCNGDSGGPLAIDGRAVGLTSFGSASGCQKGYPAVFTRVGSYLTWIKSNTGL